MSRSGRCAARARATPSPMLLGDMPVTRTGEVRTRIQQEEASTCEKEPAGTTRIRLSRPEDRMQAREQKPHIRYRFREVGRINIVHMLIRQPCCSKIRLLILNSTQCEHKGMFTLEDRRKWMGVLTNLPPDLLRKCLRSLRGFLVNGGVSIFSNKGCFGRRHCLRRE